MIKAWHNFTLQDFYIILTLFTFFLDWYIISLMYTELFDTNHLNYRRETQIYTQLIIDIPRSLSEQRGSGQRKHVWYSRSFVTNACTNIPFFLLDKHLLRSHHCSNCCYTIFFHHKKKKRGAMSFWPLASSKGHSSTTLTSFWPLLPTYLSRVDVCERIPYCLY